jgi:hypothetical protein
VKREEKILKLIDKAGYGVEIGPSYNPIAPKKAGYKVHVIDQMNHEELRAHYQGHGQPLENIEEVDYVWQGESYRELTGKSKFYDWVIASHVIEHTPNLIGFLENCDQILKDDGVLSLAIPDSRYSFDHFRPLTSLAQVLDAHFQKHTHPSAGTAYEYHLNVVTKGGQIVWENRARGEYRFIHSPETARQMMEQVLQEQTYSDLHVWCFTPSSFRLLIQDLYDLGLSPFREFVFFPTVGCEFFVTLGRKGSEKNVDRLSLLKKIKAEWAS